MLIWALTCRAKHLRTPSNMLVVSLVLFDFIQMSKTPVFIVNSFNEGPIFGRLGCDIYGILGAYGGLGSSLTNAAIAYDRYRFFFTSLFVASGIGFRIVGSAAFCSCFYTAKWRLKVSRLVKMLPTLLTLIEMTGADGRFLWIYFRSIQLNLNLIVEIVLQWSKLAEFIQKIGQLP